MNKVKALLKDMNQSKECVEVMWILKRVLTDDGSFLMGACFSILYLDEF